MSFVSDLTGRTGKVAARRAGELQFEGTERGVGEIEAGTERGLGFLDPFQQVGAQGVEQAGFLTDPQAQFDFIQQNPLFRAALEQAQTRTQGTAAARGRLSAGDTLQALSENVLLSAAPLIGEQKRSIQDLLGFGERTAFGQADIVTGAAPSIADLITGGAASLAGGEIGAARASGRGSANLLETGLLAGGII